ncbi:MAG: type I glutamate--ammonia ligase [Chloroflexi bacterium]|nr:type I glutamate--ammonia ligase [Chloroflexota bacterium]
MTTTPKEVIAFAQANGLKFVDYKFVDLIGLWQHFSSPIEELEEAVFTEGVGFDGSSIRGFQSIHESDMILIPDPTTAVVDPACAVPTLSLVCNVKDPLTGEPYTRDSRYIAQKAEAYLKSTGVADESYWGPEAEFFVFDSVSYAQDQHSAHYAIDSGEGIWNSDKPGLGHIPRWKEGYFPVSPMDTLQDFRSEVVLELMKAGVPVEVHHHEVATAGQCEIDMRFSPLVKMGDHLMMYKYVIKNYAKSKGKTVTFMPKPIWGDNGSGMHVHQSLWKEGKTLMADTKGYAGLSQLSRYYIGGLLKHAPALLALVAPTVNSYHRLVPGFEAPVNLVYSRRNRSAAVRIPMYSENPKAKRIEFRCPDPAANPYLAFAAMLMAGLDGIKNQIDPGEPADYDLFELHGEEARKIKQVPGSLPEALAALEADHAFLLEGGVFTQDVIDVWLQFKRSREIDPIRLRPHPYEFYLYYEV